MAITYQSDNSSAILSASSLTITKPSGLAEGDLMIALLSGEAEEETWSASGWTLVDSISAAGINISMAVLYKVADSGDVAASNFTFNFSTTDKLKGLLSRVTGAEPTYNVFSTDSDTNPGSSSSSVTLTMSPDMPNSQNDILLFFMVSTLFGGVADGSKYSAYAIAIDNPTWTERYDSCTSDFGMAVATGPRSSVASTGDWSLTVNTSGNSAQQHGIGFVIAESIDVDIPIDSSGVLTLSQGGSHTINTDSYISIDMPGTLTLYGNGATVSSQEYEVYSDQSKSSTNWSNQSK